MALDTALKRGSATNHSCPWRPFLPFPDGTVDQPDRQTFFLYSGISAGEAVEEAAAPALGAGGGWKKRKRLFLFPDGTLEYCNEAEAYAIAAEMNMELPAKQEAPKPVPVTRKTTAVVARQQLIGFLKATTFDTGPARLELARLIRKLRENERKLKELEEEEEIAIILTLLH